MKPSRLSVELTNHCNGTCSFCPHQLMERKEGHMQFELFQKVVDEGQAMGVKKFSIYNFGDPLLYPKLFEAIDYVGSKGFDEIVLSTNAIALTEEVAEKLLQSKLTLINLSLHAFKKETYERICGPYFDKVMENSQRIAEMKKKMGVKKPQVQALMAIVKENLNEVPQFNQFWRDKVDLVGFNHFEEFKHSNAFGKARERHYVPDMDVKLKRVYCKKLERGECHVHWNGDITPCCVDFEGQIVVGNVKDKSVLDVFNNEKFEKMRKLQSQGKWDELPVCRECTTWQW